MQERIKYAFYQKFNASRVGNKIEKRKALQDDIIYKLYQMPMKDTGVARPKIRVPQAQTVYMSDILMLPPDGDYRYALTVVDCNNSMCDARPLISKTPSEVKEAFIDIFENGKYLKAPKIMLQTDGGGEFKGETQKYFDSIGVFIRRGLPNRHNSQSKIESLNKVIGKALFMRMNSQNLLEQDEDNEFYNTNWTDDLAVIIESINSIFTNETVKLKEESIGEHATSKNLEMLTEGDKVRIKLDTPIEIGGEQLSGKFRAGDIRWSPKIHTIAQLVIRPDQPIMYLIDDQNGHRLPCAYTRAQLQIVSENENLPPQSVIRKSKEREYKHEDPDYIPEEDIKRSNVKPEEKRDVYQENYNAVKHVTHSRANT
jgi:hypothetical protein